MRLVGLCVGVVLTFNSAASACSQYVPGVLSTRVARLQGTVQATTQPAYQTKLGERPLVAGAAIEVRKRTDTAFVLPAPNDPPWQKDLNQRFQGAIKHYDCGKVVARTTTNDKGAFALSKIPVGQYCLIVTPRPSKLRSMLFQGERRQFAVDIVRHGPERLLADITPLNTDCNGGGELRAITK